MRMYTLPVTLMLKGRQSGKSFFLFILSLGVAFTVILFGPASGLSADSVDRPFRLAITSSIFTDVNENDIRAALKVWVKTFAEEQRIHVDPDPHMHRTLDDLIRYARANPVDGFGITTPEYAILRREMDFDLFAAGSIGGQIEVVYILLVRQDSGLERLDQLAGRSLNVVDNPFMSLAVIWLDTALLEAKLKRTSRFFRQVTMDRKISQVVLPVFFGKVEACLVKQDGFEVMSALNPQLKKQLRILAASPPLVPAGLAFLRGSASSYRQQVLEAMPRLGDSPTGQQILELAQSEKFTVHNISCLDKSLKLLDRHRQLSGN